MVFVTDGRNEREQRLNQWFTSMPENYSPAWTAGMGLAPRRNTLYYQNVAVRKEAGKKSPAKETSASGGKKKTSSGGSRKYSWIVLFWLVFTIFIFGLFIFNREAIFNSIGIIKNEMTARKKGGEEMPSSGLPEVSSPAVPPAEPVAAPPVEHPPAAIPPRSAPPPRRSPAPPSAPAARAAPSAPQAVSTIPAAPAEGSAPAPAVSAAQNRPQTQRPQVRQETGTQERVLYFIQVDGGGVVLRIKTNRRFPVSDTPMVDVISALIAGPGAEEKQKGLISLIPPETRILSATVRGNTAYINFSEDFLYNTYGVDGYAGQIKQIVFTATEFSTVADVQILIEGRRVDYLGETIWIGSPLGRNAFD